jgi:DNA-directed RNA polymerase specialized sigma24 family protein
MSFSTTIHLERCLKRLGDRDDSARKELLEFAYRRLKILADRMFLRFPLLYAREQSDDLFQEAMFRLWQSLEQVAPLTVAGFMGLAAAQMRRSLADLARRHFGRDNELNAAGSYDRPIIQGGDSVIRLKADDSRNAPPEMASWSEFHWALTAFPNRTEPHSTCCSITSCHRRKWRN